MPRDSRAGARDAGPQRSLYQPYYVDGAYDKRFAVTVFPRDPSTGLQVWSGDTGYPGDPNYLDFHKKRFPGGHRYWRSPAPGRHRRQAGLLAGAGRGARERTRQPLRLAWSRGAAAGFNRAIPPVLCAPFDAELFGHWWFEGPMWLEAVCRTAARARREHRHHNLQRVSGTLSARRIHRDAGRIMGRRGRPPGMAEPGDLVDLHAHVSGRVVGCVRCAPRASGARRAGHAHREAALPRIAAAGVLRLAVPHHHGAARDYAEMRFLTHNDQFLELKTMWEAFEHDGGLNEHMTVRLAEIEQRDMLFPEIDPSLWAEGA